MSRIGPALKIVASCGGCVHEHCKSYAVQGDSGNDVYCMHPEAKNKNATNGYGYIADTTWTTPAWCPLLEKATVDLAVKKAAEVARRLAPELSPQATPKLVLESMLRAYESAALKQEIAEHEKAPVRYRTVLNDFSSSIDTLRLMLSNVLVNSVLPSNADWPSALVDDYERRLRGDTPLTEEPKVTAP